VSENFFKVTCSRKNIFSRDNHTCQYCGINGKNVVLTIDHVVPRSKGGKNTWDNVTTACSSCNQKKGNSLLEDTSLKLRSIPQKPKRTSIIKSKFSTTDENWLRYLI
jgi:5-methylcytosine-specific restriction endonuclease McrA